MTHWKDNIPKLSSSDAEEITRLVGLPGFEFALFPQDDKFAMATGMFTERKFHHLTNLLDERLKGTRYERSGITRSLWHDEDGLREYTLSVRARATNLSNLSGG